YCSLHYLYLYSFPTRRSSDLYWLSHDRNWNLSAADTKNWPNNSSTTSCSRRSCLTSLREFTHIKLVYAENLIWILTSKNCTHKRSEEHTSELQSRFDLVCRLL